MQVETASFCFKDKNGLLLGSQADVGLHCGAVQALPALQNLYHGIIRSIYELEKPLIPVRGWSLWVSSNDLYSPCFSS